MKHVLLEVPKESVPRYKRTVAIIDIKTEKNRPRKVTRNKKKKKKKKTKKKKKKNKKNGKRKVQGVPQSQTAALPRHQEEEKTDKSKQTQIEQTYEKHYD